MSVTDAKEKCPQLVLVKGEDLTHYREMSYKVTGRQEQLITHEEFSSFVGGDKLFWAAEIEFALTQIVLFQLFFLPNVPMCLPLRECVVCV